MKPKSFRLHIRPIPEGAVLRPLAVGCVMFAWFWLIVLSPEAWVFLVGFGVPGCVAATFSLRRRPLGRADRCVLVLCLLLGASACGLAVLGK